MTLREGIRKNRNLINGCKRNGELIFLTKRSDVLDTTLLIKMFCDEEDICLCLGRTWCNKETNKEIRKYGDGEVVKFEYYELEIRQNDNQKSTN